MVTKSEEQTLSGYETADEYWATMYSQGGRRVYNIDLSLMAVASTLPRPNPSQPTAGNRRVKEQHAKSFSEYVLENENWVAPSLMLRGPSVFRFQKEKQVQGAQFGILSIPRNARVDLRIIDGQHRILGFCLANEFIAQEMEKIRSHISTAKRDGDQELEAHWLGQMPKWEALKKRLQNERISVQIHVVDDEAEYKQMFVDVADNALGISSAIRARFDSRKAVNRALEEVLKHSLLDGRVDMEQDRISGSSTYILGAKHIADIIRTLYKGISGRISKKEEQQIDEGALVESTNHFFDTLVDSFHELTEVSNEEMTPEQLRKSSLLGSATMIRILAGVYYQLEADEWTQEEIGEFFSTLSPMMHAPIEKDSKWFEIPEIKKHGVFSENMYAPNARRQTVDILYKSILQLAEDSRTEEESEAEEKKTKAA